MFVCLGIAERQDGQEAGYTGVHGRNTVACSVVVVIDAN